jgi:hypothetical protein
MQINTISSTGRLTLDTSARELNGWRVGQILEGIAVAKAAGGSVEIQIGADKVLARTDLALEPGQSLRFKVVSLGEPIVLQRVVDAEPTGGDAETRADILRQVLPKQAPLAPMLEQLGPKAQQIATVDPKTSKRLATSVTALLTQLPDVQSVTQPHGTRVAIANSGTFLEAKLLAGVLSGAPLPDGDLKANLLRVAASLNELHGQLPGANATQTVPADPHNAEYGTTVQQLSKSIEAGLARIELNQMNSVVHDPELPPAWSLDLPVRADDRIDAFQIKIEEDAHRHDPNAAPAGYAINISFELPDLGPVHAKLQLVGETLSASLWAEQAATHALIDANLERLRQRLTQADLNVAHLQSFLGRPTRSEALVAGDESLVNIRI